MHGNRSAYQGNLSDFKSQIRCVFFSELVKSHFTTNSKPQMKSLLRRKMKTYFFLYEEIKFLANIDSFLILQWAVICWMAKNAHSQIFNFFKSVKLVMLEKSKKIYSNEKGRKKVYFQPDEPFLPFFKWNAGERMT